MTQVVQRNNHVLQVLKRLKETLDSDKKKYADKVNVLVMTWERIAASAKEQRPLAAICIVEKMYKDTLSVMLQGEWPKMSPVSKTHLIQMLNRCRTDLCKHMPWLHTRFRKLLELVNDPWTLPSLERILHREPCPPTSEQIVEFCVSERGLLIITRLNMLCSSRCEKVAIKLAEACYGALSSGSPALMSLFSTNEYNFIFDIYLCLLYKYKKLDVIINMLKTVSVTDGYYLVVRLRKRIDLHEQKIWKFSLQVAAVAARYFVTVSMLSRPITNPSLIKSLITDWLSMVTSMEHNVENEVRKVMQPAETSEHIYLMAEVLTVLSQQLGNDMYRSLIIELYIRAVTADINYLERVKLQNDKEQLTAYEKHLASKFLALADLVKGHSGVRREFVLTAFSIHPSAEIYRRVEEEAVASGKASPHSTPTSQESIEVGVLSEGLSSMSSEEPDGKETAIDYSVNNDSQDSGAFLEIANRCPLHLPYDGIGPEGELCFQCGDFTGIQTPHSPTNQQQKKKERSLDALILIKGNTVTESLNYDALSAPSQVLEAEKLGLSPQVCADLVTLLGSNRYHLLTWVLEWGELSSRCLRYMDEADTIKSGKKELKFLEIDYNQYKDWPENDDEGDCIEKGYEHWLEDENTETDIDTDSKRSNTDDSEEMMIKTAIRRSQKQMGRYAESSSDSEDSRSRARHRKRGRPRKRLKCYSDSGSVSDSLGSDGQKQKRSGNKHRTKSKDLRKRLGRLKVLEMAGEAQNFSPSNDSMSSEAFCLPTNTGVGRSDPTVLKSLRAFRPSPHKSKADEFVPSVTESCYNAKMFGDRITPSIKPNVFDCNDNRFMGKGERFSFANNDMEIHFKTTGVKTKQYNEVMSTIKNDLISVSNIPNVVNNATVNVFHLQNSQRSVGSCSGVQSAAPGFHSMSVPSTLASRNTNLLNALQKPKSENESQGSQIRKSSSSQSLSQNSEMNRFRADAASRRYIDAPPVTTTAPNVSGSIYDFPVTEKLENPNKFMRQQECTNVNRNSFNQNILKSQNQNDGARNISNSVSSLPTANNLINSRHSFVSQTPRTPQTVRAVTASVPTSEAIKVENERSSVGLPKASTTDNSIGSQNLREGTQATTNHIISGRNYSATQAPNLDSNTIKANLESTNPITELARPVAEPTKPNKELARGFSQPGKNNIEPIRAILEPVMPSTGLVKPNHESSRPIVKPNTELAKVIVEPVETNTEIAKVIVEPVEAYTEFTRSIDEPVGTKTELTEGIVGYGKPDPDLSRPVVEPVQVRTELTEAIVEPVKSNTELARPIAEAENPSGELMRPISESVSPVSEPIQPYREITRPKVGKTKPDVGPSRLVEPKKPSIKSSEPTTQPVKPIKGPIKRDVEVAKPKMSAESVVPNVSNSKSSGDFSVQGKRSPAKTTTIASKSTDPQKSFNEISGFSTLTSSDSGIVDVSKANTTTCPTEREGNLYSKSNSPNKPGTYSKNSVNADVSNRISPQTVKTNTLSFSQTVELENVDSVENKNSLSELLSVKRELDSNPCPFTKTENLTPNLVKVNAIQNVEPRSLSVSSSEEDIGSHSGLNTNVSIGSPLTLDVRNVSSADPSTADPFMNGAYDFIANDTPQEEVIVSDLVTPDSSILTPPLDNAESCTSSVVNQKSVSESDEVAVFESTSSSKPNTTTTLMPVKNTLASVLKKQPQAKTGSASAAVPQYSISTLRIPTDGSNASDAVPNIMVSQKSNSSTIHYTVVGPVQQNIQNLEICDGVGRVIKQEDFVTPQSMTMPQGGQVTSGNNNTYSLNVRDMEQVKRSLQETVNQQQIVIESKRAKPGSSLPTVQTESNFIKKQVLNNQQITILVQSNDGGDVGKPEIQPRGSKVNEVVFRDDKKTCITFRAIKRPQPDGIQVETPVKRKAIEAPARNQNGGAVGNVKQITSPQAVEAAAKADSNSPETLCQYLVLEAINDPSGSLPKFNQAFGKPYQVKLPQAIKPVEVNEGVGNDGSFGVAEQRKVSAKVSNDVGVTLPNQVLVAESPIGENTFEIVQKPVKSVYIDKEVKSNAHHIKTNEGTLGSSNISTIQMTEVQQPAVNTYQTVPKVGRSSVVQHFLRKVPTTGPTTLQAVNSINSLTARPVKSQDVVSSSTLIYATDSRAQSQIVIQRAVGRVAAPAVRQVAPVVYTQSLGEQSLPQTQTLLLTTVPTGTRNVVPGTQLVRLPTSSGVWKMAPAVNQPRIVQLRPQNVVLQGAQDQSVMLHNVAGGQPVVLHQVTSLPVKPIGVVANELKTDHSKVDVKNNIFNKSVVSIEDPKLCSVSLEVEHVVAKNGASNPAAAVTEHETVSLMKDIKEFENVFEETKLKFEMEEQQSVCLSEIETITPAKAPLTAVNVHATPLNHSVHQTLVVQPQLMLHKPQMIITSAVPSQQAIFTQKIDKPIAIAKDQDKTLILTAKPKIERHDNPSRVAVTYVSRPTVSAGPPAVTVQKPLVVVTSYAQPPTSPVSSITSQNSSPSTVASTVPSSYNPPTTSTPITKTPSKPKSRSSKSHSSSNGSKSPPSSKNQQKPNTEDPNTAQKIYAILEEYAVQLRNSPDVNNRPAPRRRLHPIPGLAKRRKSVNKNKDTLSDGEETNFVEETVENLPLSEDSSSNVTILQVCVSSSS